VIYRNFVGLFALVRLPVAVGWVRLRGHVDPTVPLARLGAFRTELHACFLRRADALFELSDALLCAQTPLPSLPHLSLEPVHSPEGAINAHPAGWCRRQVLGAVAAFVTVMLPGVPAWAPDWAGARWGEWLGS
jgi:hypothetical protein